MSKNKDVEKLLAQGIRKAQVGGRKTSQATRQVISMRLPDTLLIKLDEHLKNNTWLTKTAFIEKAIISQLKKDK